jgi:glycosyltransferase involved in cell wall biosynthesis
MKARRILDVGSGIGWSSFEIHRHRDKASVLGIDPDPVLIETANRLFADPGRIEFRVADLIGAGLDSSSAFDVVLLLDFYEHVPVSARAKLHDVLNRILAPDSIVILACRSSKGRHYFPTHDARGRQSFDEDVTENDMRMLSRALSGQLAAFQPATVGPSHPNDCNYVVIARGKCGITPSGTGAVLNLQNPAERRRRIRQRLGLAVSHGGYALPQEAGPTVCVAYHSCADSAESFVLQHIESLPTTVCTLIGAQPFDEVDDEGRALVSRRPLARVLSAAQRLLRRRTHLERHREAVARFLKHRGVAAVLAEFGTQALKVMYGCEHAQVPLIAHFHGQDAYARHYVSGAENERHLRDLFRIARRIIVVSRDMQRQLESLGAPAHKLRCNPCGVDLVAFAGARPAEASPQFVAVGRFVAKKAPYLTVLAFKRVLETFPDARLTMIGDGPLREVCLRLAGALGLDNRVSFPGAYPHRAVVGALSQARAFVQHSLQAFDGDSEGTPVGILEAAASGLPVVSTRHAGIKEAVIHEHTGILVDEGDWQAMAAGMLRLAQDPALADRMGSAGRSHVAANYSMPARIGSLWEIIREAIADRPGR